MRLGALWNTMVIAAKVDTLWSLGSLCFPEMMRLFEVYSASIGGPREEQVLEGIYQVMPSRNFSAHLLQEFPKHVAVMELRDVVWSTRPSYQARCGNAAPYRQRARFLVGRTLREAEGITDPAAASPSSRYCRSAHPG